MAPAGDPAMTAYVPRGVRRTGDGNLSTTALTVGTGYVTRFASSDQAAGGQERPAGGRITDLAVGGDMNRCQGQVFLQTLKTPLAQTRFLASHIPLNFSLPTPKD